MKKRIIGLLLALLMLACVPALADEAQWAYDNGNMVLMPSGTLSGDVTIPSEVDGYPANAIRYNAFQSNHEITSLTMPDTLRALQSGAIAWMDGLTSVTLNDAVSSVVVRSAKICVLAEPEPDSVSRVPVICSPAES